MATKRLVYDATKDPSAIDFRNARDVGAQWIGIDGKNFLVATDGRHLVAIQTTMDGSHAPTTGQPATLVPDTVLRAAAAHARKNKHQDTIVDLQTSGEGTLASARDKNGATVQCEAKAVSALPVKEILPDGPPAIRITLDAELLLALQKSLGGDAIEMEIRDAESVVRVTRYRHDEAPSMADASFGLVMPWSPLSPEAREQAAEKLRKKKARRR